MKFSFSDDNFSKPTANLEMFLIPPPPPTPPSLSRSLPPPLLSDRGIKRQQDEGDRGGSVAFSLAI